MHCGFARGRIVERACGNDHSLAITRRMGDLTVAFATNLAGEALRFGQIETPH
jgi:hypothetical protein